MLDGNRYYSVFPDEQPELRRRLRSLLEALRKLQMEVQEHIERPDADTPHVTPARQSGPG